MRSFGSDNNSGVHPRILQAIKEANVDHAIGYGDDEWTRKAEDEVIKLLENEDVQPLFVLMEQGPMWSHYKLAPCLFIAFFAHLLPILQWMNVVHRKITGASLKEIATPTEKSSRMGSTPLTRFRFEHHSQPKVIAISQTTELGTCYMPQEIKHWPIWLIDTICIFCGRHTHGKCLCLSQSFVERNDRGLRVDIFTIGGTKNGLMMGEVVVPLHKELAENLKYYRKQTTQLYSKMRFISAQFIPYFKENIWLENARKSNAAAQRLASEMGKIEDVQITQKVQSNSVFFILPKPITDKLRNAIFLRLGRDP